MLLRALSELLMDFDDVVYKRRIVDMLNTIVMTTSELHSLRIRLKDMKTEVRDPRNNVSVYPALGVLRFALLHTFPLLSNRGASSRASTRAGA